MWLAGILSSVGDLNVTSHDAFLVISWTAPFSLDVTGVDHDVWYSVLVYNVTEKQTAITCTDCINTTETNYTFVLDYHNNIICHKYIFTVIPFNGAGKGQPSSENITTECTVATLIICMQWVLEDCIYRVYFIFSVYFECKNIVQML